MFSFLFRKERKCKHATIHYILARVNFYFEVNDWNGEEGYPFRFFIKSLGYLYLEIASFPSLLIANLTEKISKANAVMIIILSAGKS